MHQGLSAWRVDFQHFVQVNTAGRDAAISPGSSDSLAAFAGTYATHLLPGEVDGQVAQGSQIAIKVNAQGEWPNRLPHSCSGHQGTHSQKKKPCALCDRPQGFQPHCQTQWW